MAWGDAGPAGVRILCLVLCCVGVVLAQTVPPGISAPPGVTLAPPPPGAVMPPVAGVPGMPPGPPMSAANDLVQREINTMTRNITAAVESTYDFCVTTGERERDEVFGFNLTTSSPILAKCFADTGGLISSYLCSYGEIKLYFDFIKDLDAPKPNLNCNASAWGPQCESGWAGLTLDTGSSISSPVVPVRDQMPIPCCDGFFCPRGLSCMFPCPLGAYCPRAVLNETSAQCDPYGYQVPQGQASIAGKCGGADRWADLLQSEKLFCKAGLFCPTQVTANNCTKGHYCRTGSTAPFPCSKLTTCSKERLEKENLAYIGGLIIAILTITLVLVFTCSDWLLDIRKKRKSKARALAQKKAAESVTGLERFRHAREAAKRGATTFSRKLSVNLSRRRPVHDDSFEELQFLQSNVSGAHNVETIAEDSSVHFSPVPLVTPKPTDSSDESKDNFTTHAPHEEFTPEAKKPKDHSGKRVSILNLLPQTQSQIFAYAYGEIEKEKAAFGSSSSNYAQEENPEADYYGSSLACKQRPPIELSFVDLSLFLKGSNKKILSNVTGKLSPGRVTAVMGPSGAGKTTFLNALAGKATHSTTTGAVFINGKPDSIQSYKSIIGFVPQDDIVHGNLTVEENLWFSASYRLPVGMSKRDKVLVVERIIAALGLGPIRDSEVGTVEKRGISGGQRKRVNVGLEMVMEPSLLILDEPTSGLDSTSSRLVLQALRREANMGVNVGVVLHQPSYGLFRMFDDVMFLAKGGRTVYLGPVSEVEAYFCGIGLVVPERINPPDHYMDALEGIAVPQDQPDFDPSNLPVMWMMHKEYNIPVDLKDIASDLQAGAPRGKSMKKRHGAGEKRMTSFLQDFWTECKAFLIVKKDLILSSFHREENKSGRTTPGFLAQFFVILRRLTKQRFRESRVQFQDYVLLLLAGVCLGPLSLFKDSNLGVTGYFYTLIALALLIMIASLRTFSGDKLTFWRESASGINRVAYFLAKDVVDLFNVALKPVIYLSMFYFFANPRSTFASNFIVTLVLVYCVTGVAYICSILMEPAPAQLWSVFLPILATLIISVNRSGILEKIQYLSYARYANEAYAIANSIEYRGVWIITRCAVMQSTGYSIHNWARCLIVLVAYGMVARGIALICLFTSNRNKQK